jgi:hypothetical protein
MISLPKFVGVVACGFLLCLGLSTAGQADNAGSTAERLKADQSDRRQGGQAVGKKQMMDMESSQSKEGRTITGEVLRVEGNDCFIKGQDGKEVRLHIDLTTMKARNIEPGEHIEAKVDEQNHALSILSAQAIMDRRNDKE